jgi:hypothetical protein
MGRVNQVAFKAGGTLGGTPARRQHQDAPILSRLYFLQVVKASDCTEKV